MVQSVRDHGILNPVIVRKVYGGYVKSDRHQRGIIKIRGSRQSVVNDRKIGKMSEAVFPIFL
jgi:hypothetical protein